METGMTKTNRGCAQIQHTICYRITVIALSTSVDRNLNNFKEDLDACTGEPRHC